MAKKKATAKIKRRKKLLYKCSHKQEALRRFFFEEENEHGAKNNVYKLITAYDLQFTYDAQFLIGKVPEVLSSVLSYSTTNKEIADAYKVGEEYDRLPQ